MKSSSQKRRCGMLLDYIFHLSNVHLQEPPVPPPVDEPAAAPPVPPAVDEPPPVPAVPPPVDDPAPPIAPPLLEARAKSLAMPIEVKEDFQLGGLGTVTVF